MAGLVVGDRVARTAQFVIEYAPEPPSDAESMDTAPAVAVASAMETLTA